MKYSLIPLVLIFALAACTAPDVIAPTPPEPLDQPALVGKAYFTPDSMLPGAFHGTSFAPPWDVWNNNALVLRPTQELYAPNTDARVDVRHGENNVKLTYDSAYVLTAGETTWKQLAVTQDGTPTYKYAGFLHGNARIDVPKEYLERGENIVATYVCTEIVPVQTQQGTSGVHACGCQENTLENCGYWNIQVVDVGEQAVCSNTVCESGESYLTCPEDCLEGPQTPGELNDTITFDKAVYLIKPGLANDIATFTVTNDGMPVRADIFFQGNGHSRDIPSGPDGEGYRIIGNVTLIPGTTQHVVKESINAPVFASDQCSKNIIVGLITVGSNDPADILAQDTVELGCVQDEDNPPPQPASSIVEFRLITVDGSFVSTTLSEGETRVIEILGMDYEVTILVVGQSSDGIEAKLLVNGEVTDGLQEGENDILSDGTTVEIMEILYEGSEQSSIVEFYFGANKIAFEVPGPDQPGSVEINRESIEDAEITLNYEYALDANGDGEFGLNGIVYTLFSDGVDPDVYVPRGGNLRAYLDEPEGMLSELDIYYEDGYEGPANPIEFIPEGDDTYNLRFTNQLSHEYVIPYVEVTQDGEHVTFGNQNNRVVFFEGFGNTASGIVEEDHTFFVREDDHFVLTANNDLSTVWAFVDVDTADQTVSFENTHSGDVVQVSYTEMYTGSQISSETFYDDPSGEITYAGQTFTFWLRQKVGDVPKLAIDLDGDGLLVGEESRLLDTRSIEQVPIIVRGGGILLLYSQEITGTQFANDWSVTLTTPAKFVDSGVAQVSEIEFTFDTTTEELNAQIADTAASGTYFREHSISEDAAYALNGYGTRFEAYERDDEANPVVIWYPSIQMLPEVYVVAGGLETIDTPQEDAQRVGVDGNDLEIGEFLGIVKSHFSDEDLRALQTVRFTTSKGSIAYLQNMYLPLRSGIVGLFENSDDEIEQALFYNDGEEIFTYEARFDGFARSDIESFVVEDFIDESLYILGEYYGIIGAEVSNTGKLTLTLMAGDLVDTLQEGDTRTYTVDGVDYEIVVLVIGNGQVKFLVNGETTDSLSEGDTDTLSNGIEIGVREIIETNAYRDEPASWDECPVPTCQEAPDECYYESSDELNENGCPAYPCGQLVCA